MNNKLRKICFIFLLSIVINSVYGKEIPYKKGTPTDTLINDFKNLQHKKDDQYFVLFNNNDLLEKRYKQLIKNIETKGVNEMKKTTKETN